MGDTGSNLLGYLLATIAVLGALKTNAVVALFFPLIVLAVPILDSGFVIAKRLKYRRPIYEADRWHFHHRMANIGFSQRRTLAYLYGWALVLAGLALALRFVPYSDDHGHFDPAWTAVMVGCGVAAVAQRVPACSCSRSSSCGAPASGSWSPRASRCLSRRRWTPASSASSRPGASPPSIPRPASSRRSCTDDRLVRGRKGSRD